MKTLYVLRHGQAVPDAEAQSDHQRALTPRGRADVRRAAQYLSKRPHLPSLVMTSSATRALQTAKLCLAALPDAPKLMILDGLYLAEPLSYLEELAADAEPHAAVVATPGWRRLSTCSPSTLNIWPRRHWSRSSCPSRAGPSFGALAALWAASCTAFTTNVALASRFEPLGMPDAKLAFGRPRGY
jgi:broad specificity phosphatase PhoE